MIENTAILELHPAVIYGGNSDDPQGTYHLSVQTPAPIPDAILADVYFSGERVSRGGFTSNEKQQTIQFEIGGVAARNLVNNDQLVIGTTLIVTLVLHAAGNREVFRTAIDVPVVAKPATDPDVDQTARDAAAAAERNAATALALADAAPTVAESTAIADARAAARYTDAEKAKLAGLNAPRTFTIKAAVSGAANTWTYELDANDTEIYIRGSIPGTNNPVTARAGGLIMRDDLAAAAAYFIIDSRVPGGHNIPDNKTFGVQASIAGNTLTLNTTGWLDVGTPVVRSK